MLTNRISGLHMLHTCCQACLLVGLFWSWYLLFFWFVGSASSGALEYATFVPPLLAGLFVHAGRANRRAVNVLGFTFAQAVRFSFNQIVFAVGGLLIFLVATKDQGISRAFLFSFVPLLGAVLLVSTRCLARLLAAKVFQGARIQNVLLVGSSAEACQMTGWLRRKTLHGIRTVGLVNDEADGQPVPGLPWLGRLDDLERIIQQTGATQLLLVETPLAPAKLAPLAEICERLGVRFTAVQDFRNLLTQPITLREDDGLYFARIHPEPLECPLNWSLKRCFDIAVSLPVVFLVLPVATLLVWLLQRWQSPGPLFYRQQRHGIHNQVFSIWKFRTMHHSAGSSDDARQATSDDARIFPAGCWLRQHSVDELPQFLNVLWGEMSLVGPRPHFVQHTTQFSNGVRRYHLRSFVKPGITGLAQVQSLRGEIRNARDVLRRVEWDIHYLENWSLLIDLKIVLRTAWQMVVPPKTAY